MDLSGSDTCLQIFGLNLRIESSRLPYNSIPPCNASAQLSFQGHVHNNIITNKVMVANNPLKRIFSLSGRDFFDFIKEENPQQNDFLHYEMLLIHRQLLGPPCKNNKRRPSMEIKQKRSVTQRPVTGILAKHTAVYPNHWCLLVFYRQQTRQTHKTRISISHEESTVYF